MFILIKLFSTFFCFSDCTPAIYQAEWKNPPIVLKLKPRERAIKQFPLPSNKKHTQENIEGFQEFGARMAARFSESGMSVTEATEIYQLIARENLVRQGSYGMPSPGKKPSQPVQKDLEKTLSLKKIKEGHFELFYSYSGCGTNYVHQTIKVESNKIIKKTTLEKWSGSYPC